MDLSVVHTNIKYARTSNIFSDNGVGENIRICQVHVILGREMELVLSSISCVVVNSSVSSD
jgi:hypothetical protein